MIVNLKDVIEKDDGFPMWHSTLTEITTRHKSTYLMLITSSSGSSSARKSHCKDKYVYKRVDISIMLICDASGIKGYDRGILELSNAPRHMK